MRKITNASPLRAAIAVGSELQPRIEDGMGAIKPAHRDCFDSPIRQSFADSLDIDEAFRVGNEQENRWDYVLGHASSGSIIAVEPHSAKDDEVNTVIRKRQAALDQLRGHLQADACVAKWIWVASSKVKFAATEKVRRRLDQHGIEFAGGRVLARHLPEKEVAASKRGTSRRR